MKASSVTRIFACLLLQLFCLLNGQAAEEARPNIVIMMLDDLGYSDFGCYGSEIRTPHIDALAAGGLRFRNFHNTAKCHSSRVALLTGLYSDQAGDAKMDRAITVAEAMKPLGYRSLMVGKWHLSKSPTERGFDRYFGHLSGATNFFKGDHTFRLDGEKWSDFGPDFYTTDANIKFAKGFVADSLEKHQDKPFLLYIAHNAPHYPLHVRKEDFERYRGIYEKGWDQIRAGRYQKQLASELIPKTWKLSARPQMVPEWSALDEDQQKLEVRRMMAFAGMVDRVDQTTGDLIQFLKDKGVYENTIIMICSDNGACPFDRTKNGEKDPWDPESYWCYDTGWSHVGNTPFRLHKQNQHGGGINTPLIVHWPAGLKATAGSVVEERGHLVDLLPTCLELAGAEMPSDSRVKLPQALAGRSLVPIIEGKGRSDEGREYFFRFSDNRALIVDDWKLVTHRASRWELYQIREDGTELNDLAAQQAQRVQQMSKRWRQLAEDPGKLGQQQIRPVKDKAPPILKKDGTPLKKSK